jgi:hypothetical protein
MEFPSSFFVGLIVATSNFGKSAEELDFVGIGFLEGATDGELDCDSAGAAASAAVEKRMAVRNLAREFAAEFIKHLTAVE